MNTIIIRITNEQDEHGWPVELCFDDGTEDWFQKPVASGSILTTLPTMAFPPAIGGTSLEVSGIVQFLLDNATSPAYLAIGQHLFTLLHSSEIGPKWDEIRTAHEAPTGTGLRTILEIEPPELKGLPWEALTDQMKVQLFCDSTNPFLRGPITFTKPLEPYLVPLRIMVVVGDQTDTQLEWQQEIDAIRSGIVAFKGKAEVEFLLGPTQEQLNRMHAKFQPDIFHFIGHGIQSSGGPALLLNSKEQGKLPLTYATIVNNFKTTTGRLAILNACRSDQAAPEDPVTLNMQTWGLADAFRNAGYHSVVGMQADIPAPASVAFTRTLYQKIGSGSPVDVAVAEARKQTPVGRTDVMGTANEDLRDWIVPSLTASVAPETILAPTYAVDPNGLKEIERTFEAKKIEAFVDRGKARTSAWDQIEGKSEAKSRDLLVVHGSPDIGKTWLLWHVLRKCAWRGRSVYYVNFKNGETLSLPKMLERIRDGSDDSFFIRSGNGHHTSGLSNGVAGASRPTTISRGLPDDARDRLTHHLYYLRRGLPPQEGELPTPESDDDDLWQPGERIDAVFQTLSEILELAAGGTPLVVAFDQLESIENATLRQFVNYFLRSVAKRNDSSVRVIVALQSWHLQADWWPDELTGLPEEIHLQEIEDEFKPLAREFLQNLGYDPDILTNVIDGLVQDFAKRKQTTWRPKLLTPLNDMARLINAARI